MIGLMNITRVLEIRFGDVGILALLIAIDMLLMDSKSHEFLQMLIFGLGCQGMSSEFKHCNYLMS